MMFFCHWSIVVLLLLNFGWIFPCQIPWPHHPVANGLCQDCVTSVTQEHGWALGEGGSSGRVSPGAADLTWLCCRSSCSGVWRSVRATSEPFRLFPRMNICQCIKCRDSILETVFCALSLAHCVLWKVALREDAETPNYHWSDCSRRCLYCLLLWGEVRWVLTGCSKGVHKQTWGQGLCCEQGKPKKFSSKDFLWQ